MKMRAIYALAALLLAACSKPTLSVSDAYVRAPVADRSVTAAFMTIANNGQTDIALQAAGSPAAGKVELHEHTHDNGMMRMRQVEAINIPAQSSVALQPGGYHMMLLDINPELRNQEKIAFDLRFSNGETVRIDAAVRSLLDNE